ncbi:hypothetical protein [Acinetobacter stercoris]|uniref:Uncharacterized protein n=1 Tax=Acinetobacter stercoris TaxID=2126983 RepID=A0A2U3MVD2_9GAMM|nr:MULTISPECIES: hypothetical protein [Acinetobacter]SPL69313.1 hypothetical protein KPC_0491 [Acinetobacter stercoris]
MNSQFKSQREYREIQRIQSYYEPALKILNEIFEKKKLNLRSKGFDEKNAAVTKEEFSQLMARRFRITQWYAKQIITSLVNSNSVESFMGYVKPKYREDRS